MSVTGIILPESVLATLSSSKAFQVLRSHLTSEPDNRYAIIFYRTQTISLTPYSRPCSSHSDPDQSTIAVVSTLHILLQPITHLHSTCTRLAHAALCRPKPSELELAFSNEARSSFLWLTCLLDDSEIRAWMATEGCPTCVVERTLSCDDTVRMALTACLVARTRAEKQHDVDIPDLSFFLDAMQTAIDNDAFWAPGCHADLLAKAEKLCAGIQAMVEQAGVLDILVSSPAPSPTTTTSTSTRAVVMPPSHASFLPSSASTRSIALRASPMARRQQTLRQEEEAHLLSLRRLAWQVNSAVALSKTERMALRRGPEVCAARKRSLSWQP
jgi:hypothetical protein